MVEIETPFTHGKVFIAFGMVVMEVDFPKITPKGFDPVGKRDLTFAKSMVVTGIETESKVGRMDLVQETLQRIGGLFIDIFDGEDESHLFCLFDKGPPGLEAAFEPESHISIKIPLLITGMKDNGLWF